jgi:CRISPR-associated protein Cmr1
MSSEVQINQRKLTVTLETVTPMFLAGADQSQPELRAPSFIGALRYWFRAWQGALTNNVEVVRTKEKLIFGGVNNGATTATVRVNTTHEATVSPLQSYTKFDPRKHPADPISYLWWSQFLKSSNQSIGVIQPNSEFDVTFTTNGFVANDAALEDALKSLWLAVQFGGFGTRSRRTLGNLHCYDYPTVSNLTWLTKYECQNSKELADKLSASLRLFGLHTSPPVSLPQYHILHPQHCKIYVVSGEKPWQSWEDAMRAIATAWKAYRTTVRTSSQKIAIGLPLKGYESRDPERYGSPVFMKITPVGDKFVGVITIFRSVLPVGAKDFMATGFVKQFYSKHEVKL